MYYLWIDHLPQYKGIVFKEILYKLLINTKWGLKSSTVVYLGHETSFAYCLYFWTFCLFFQFLI